MPSERSNNGLTHGSEKRFAFGENWKRYVKTVGRAEIETAKVSLTLAFDGIDIKSATFLDIGCGSGLFSLAAYELGFARIVSFDLDKNSVEATLALRQRVDGDASRWTVMQGSVLNEEFMESLGQHVLVYSWGVLHHTGQMWKAISHVMDAVTPGGRLFIAIYNDQGWLSRYWKAVKWVYVSSPMPARFLMLLVYWTYFTLALAIADMVRLRNPLHRHRRNVRGMNFFLDVIDWVGGYPFEVAKPEEIVNFARENGFRPIWSRLVGRNQGCNEFVFEKTVRAACMEER